MGFSEYNSLMCAKIKIIQIIQFKLNALKCIVNSVYSNIN